MMNYNQIKDTLANGTVTENKVITPEAFRNKAAYETVMNNCQTIGGKRFCCIPLGMLEIDEDYQRVYCINMEKVRALVRKWNPNKYEAILVSPHPETSSFAGIDGSHRVLAAGNRGATTILAVLAEGLSDNPTERKIQEAELFSDQGKDNDRLTPAHKHRAYVTRGINKYCIVERCLQGRKLLLNNYELKNMTQEKQDALKAADYKVLTAYSDIVTVAALTNGEETLTNILDIIEKSGWHTAPNGYCSNIIRSLKQVLNIHDNNPQTVNAIISYFKYTEPDTYIAKARAKYENRRRVEALTMYLEEEVAKRLGIQPLYTGGDLRKVTSAINSQRYYRATGTENK